MSAIKHERCHANISSGQPSKLNYYCFLVFGFWLILKVETTVNRVSVWLL